MIIKCGSRSVPIVRALVDSSGVRVQQEENGELVYINRLFTPVELAGGWEIPDTQDLMPEPQLATRSVDVSMN